MNWVVMNVLGHDVQTASQSGVRIPTQFVRYWAPRCDTCRVPAPRRGDWAGLGGLTFARAGHNGTPKVRRAQRGIVFATIRRKPLRDRQSTRP